MRTRARQSLARKVTLQPQPKRSPPSKTTLTDSVQSIRTSSTLTNAVTPPPPRFSRDEVAPDARGQKHAGYPAGTVRYPCLRPVRRLSQRCARRSCQLDHRTKHPRRKLELCRHWSTAKWFPNSPRSAYDSPRERTSFRTNLGCLRLRETRRAFAPRIGGQRWPATAPLVTCSTSQSKRTNTLPTGSNRPCRSRQQRVDRCNRSALATSARLTFAS